MTRKSVLIIHTGKVDGPGGFGDSIEYGRILCSTCLLEDYRGWEVYWITCPGAAALLRENHLIDHLILAEDPDEVGPFPVEAFHTIINLDESHPWQHFAAGISALHRYSSALSDGSPASGRNQTDAGLPLQIYRMLGRQWQGQAYRLSDPDNMMSVFDVGLISSDWPSRDQTAWPADRWHQLRYLLEQDYRVGPDQGMEHLQDYIGWVASCDMVIAVSGLGLHLAIALRKRVLALLTQDEYEDTFLFGQGIKLKGIESLNCPGCQARGELPHVCLNGVAAESVAQSLRCLTTESVVTPIVALPNLEAVRT